MRFRLIDPKAAGEAVAREKVLAAMDAWWRAFAANADAIARSFSRDAPRFALPEFMSEHLGAVHPDLMWEFGPGVRGAAHRLVITPESQRQLRPMLGALLARAPALPGWELYPYRLAEPLKMANATVEGRVGGSLDGVRVCVSPNEDGGADLTYWNPAWEGPEDKKAFDVAFVATESLLGEEVLDRDIDAIEVARAPVPGARDVSLTELPACVARVLVEARATFPAKPLLEVANSAEWTLLKLTPKQAADYEEQFDLHVAKTPFLPQWRRAHSGRVFSSTRYSRFGETFCHLKIDREGWSPNAAFDDKEDLEDAVDAALMRVGLGTLVGGGTGLRYFYLDLALLDVEGAVPLLREVLQDGGVSVRSWLLFFDSALADEWVGIWDDSPAPPGFEPLDASGRA